jgi:hypothetical protein
MAQMCIGQPCTPTNVVWKGGLVRNLPDRVQQTSSSDFVNASLLQLQAAARSPFGTISETHIHAALAMIEAAAPKDEIEGALAVQMACTHMRARRLDLGAGNARERSRVSTRMVSETVYMIAVSLLVAVVTLAAVYVWLWLSNDRLDGS